MINNTEPTKRVNVKGLNNTALEYIYGSEKKGTNKMNTIIEESRKELFISLLKGNKSDIQEKLLQYVFDNEYLLAHDGGEPDMEHILAVKLLECMGISKLGVSIIYSKEYLEHVFKKEKWENLGDIKG